MTQLVKRLWQDESGQGMVEYGLIIALIAVALIAALKPLRTAIANIFGSVETELVAP